LDVAAGELRKSGILIKLQPQPFRVLLLLAERAGTVLTREEIQQHLWSESTFVDFEHGINFSINQIRGALADNAERPRYIETLPRRGYRFIATVECLPEIVEPKPSVKAAGAPPWRSALVAGLLAILLVGSYFAWRRIRPPAPTPLGRIMLAVLPFQNLTGDPEQEYLTDGVTEEMITQLGRMQPERLGVIARTSAMHYKNTQKRADEIGRELGVDYLLEGSVRRANDRVRISAQLIRVRDQTHLWAADYDRDDRDILALQSDVAKAIGRQIELKLTPEQLARFADKRQVNPECYDLYLKGRYYLNKRTEEGFKKAVEYFRQAIEKDPNYARAYAGLADSYSFLGDTTYGVRSPRETMPKAKAAAMKALELDETLAEAHTSLAAIQETFEWEWSSAEKEYKRAIELNPGYATAHHWYAVYLAQMGRLDESIAEMRRAEEDDPLSPIISENTGLMFYFARHYDQAIEQYRKAFELDPNLVIAHYDLGRAYARKGLYDEAIAEFQKAVKLSGGQPLYVAGLASAYGVAGRKAQAIKIVKELKDRSKLEYVSPYEIALVYVSLGETNHAFEWLEKAYQERSSFKDELRAAPELDGLRSDPRFDDLLKRMRLPQ